MSASTELANYGHGAQNAFVEGATERVLQLRAEGKSFKQIGDAMGLSKSAVHRWYTSARGEQLKRIASLRERAFYEDLGAIQDKLDALEADWDVGDDDCLPKLAAIVKLLEVKAKFLRYQDLKFDEATAERSRDELMRQLESQAKTLGERMAVAVVVDVEPG